MRSRRGNARILRLSECAAVAGGTLVAVLATWDNAGNATDLSTVASCVALVVTWIALLMFEHSNDIRVLGRGFEEFKRVFAGTAKLLVISAVLLLLTGISMPRETFLIALSGGLISCLGAHTVNRLYLARQRARNADARTRILLVGDATIANRVVTAISNSCRAGYAVVGIHNLPLRTRELVGNATPASPDSSEDEAELDDNVQLHAIVAMAEHTAADVVVLASWEHMDKHWLRDMRWLLRPLGTDLMILSDAAEISEAKLAVERLGELSVLRVQQPGYSPSSGLAKDVFDRITACILLILLAPVLLAVAAAVKLQDGGPVFYRPSRVGYQHKPFRMWKFRSMVTDAENRFAEVKELAGMTDAAFYKWDGDPRITRVGRVLRRTSLDELPQLLNVICGDMSLIGPRPMVEGEGEQYPNFVQRRLSVKPGMTGLWQTSGRSDLDDGQRVELDLHYVEDWSIAQDLMILLKTTSVVVRGHGAY